MSNSTTNLDLIAVAQAQKEATANALFDAASPAMLYGRRAQTSGGLVWGYYGGAALIAGVAAQVGNGTITLAASATNYVEADPATGAVSSNTTAFTAGRTRLYSVVTGTATVTSYTDLRTCAGGSVTSVSASNGVRTATGSAITATDTIEGDLPINAQTGTSYAVVTGDRGKAVTFNNAAAIAASIPAAGSTGFPSGWYAELVNLGNGVVTLTPATSTVDGAASITLSVHDNICLFSDGANYFTLRGRISGAGAGSVTSVQQTVPPEFSVSGGPITTSGTLAITKAVQTANKVWAGPTSGADAPPAFRALVLADLPAAVVGALEYQGTWNASTNSPSIATGSAASANKGFYYKVATAGTTSVDGISDYGVGDWIVSNGTTWDKIDNTESVSSVAGKTGAVTITYADLISGAPVMVGSGAGHAAGLVPDPGASAGATRFLREDGTWSSVAGASGGTVTSVALTTPGVLYSIGGSPVTGSGTLALSLISQAANSVLAGPSSGSAGAPSFRPLVAADLPAITVATPTWNTKTAAYTAVAGDNINADTSAGAFTITLPASPSANDRVQIVDALQCFDVNALTVNPNGNKIAGMTRNQVFNAAGSALVFTYQGSANGWIVAGGAAIYCGTTWNTQDSLLNAISNGRGANIYNTVANWFSMRANASRSAGKLYFEFKMDVVSTSSPAIGIGTAGANLGSYVGSDAFGWGLTANGALYHSGGSTTQSTYAAGDIVGISVDFTAGTGSINFYKNNVANGSFTGLTLSAMFPMVSSSMSGVRVTLRTRSVHCTYSPPTGYSYWDA